MIQQICKFGIWCIEISGGFQRNMMEFVLIGMEKICSIEMEIQSLFLLGSKRKFQKEFILMESFGEFQRVLRITEKGWKTLIYHGSKKSEYKRVG